MQRDLVCDSHTRYIVFTGPSLCGKTTAAQYLSEALRKHSRQTYRDSFDVPIRHYLGSLLGRKIVSMPKDEPIPELSNKTARDFAMGMAQYMRFSYGPGVLGRMLVARIGNLMIEPDFVIIDDGTNLSDMIPFDNYILIRINRENIERVYPFTIPNPHHVVSNRKTTQALRASIEHIAEQLLEHSDAKS